MINISKQDLQKIIRYKLLENYKKQLNEIGGNEQNFLTYNNFKLSNKESQEKFPKIEVNELNNFIYQKFIKQINNLKDFTEFNTIWSDNDLDEDIKLDQIKEKFEEKINIYKCHDDEEEKRFVNLKLKKFDFNTNTLDDEPYLKEENKDFIIPLDINDDEFFDKVKKILGIGYKGTLADIQLYNSNDEKVLYFYDLNNNILYFKMNNDLNKKICNELSDNILNPVKSMFGDDDWIDYLEGDISNFRARGGNLKEDENSIIKLIEDSVVYLIFLPLAGPLGKILNKIPVVKLLTNKGLNVFTAFLKFLKNKGKNTLKYFLNLDKPSAQYFYNILSFKATGKNIFETDIKQLSSQQKDNVKKLINSIDEKINITDSFHRKNKNIITEDFGIFSGVALGLLITALESISSSIDASRVWPQVEHWYAIQINKENLPDTISKYINTYILIQMMHELKQQNLNQEQNEQSIKKFASKFNINYQTCKNIFNITITDHTRSPNKKDNQSTESVNEDIIEIFKQLCNDLNIKYTDNITELQTQFIQLGLKLNNQNNNLQELLENITSDENTIIIDKIINKKK